MADIVPANRLAQLMSEVADGQWTMSGQLSQISEACLGWAIESPDEFRTVYARFEAARHGVRHGASTEDWDELKLAAQELAEVFLAKA